MIKFNSNPALSITYVGFGQGGTRIVDVFASLKALNGQPYYKTYGLNSTKNDFSELKHIPRNNLVSLELNGFGKDPSEAIDVLSMDENSQKKIEDFVDELYNQEDDLIIFCAGLGGGTGTSTIVKTLETYIAKYVTPKLDFVLTQLLEQQDLTKEDFNALPTEDQNRAKLQAMEFALKANLIKKVGIIAALPVRSDGPNTLAQVNKFSNYLWELAKNPLKGIAFVTFPDNQKFYDEFTENKSKITQKTYRDYANSRIAEVFHELNLGTNMSGTDITFDPKDFRKVMLEGEGCLNVNRMTASTNGISSEKDMYKLVIDSFNGSLLHDPIALQSRENNEMVQQLVNNVGILTVVNDDINSKDISSAYLDDAKNHLSETLSLNGSIFTGHVNISKTSFTTVAYTFYKSNGLPERLSKGLVEELEEYKKRKGSIKFLDDKIKQASGMGNSRNLDAIKEVSLEGSLGSGSSLSFLKKAKDSASNAENKQEPAALGSDSNLDFLKKLKKIDFNK